MAPLSIALFIYAFISKGMIYSTKLLYIPLVLFSYYFFAFTKFLNGTPLLLVAYFLTILLLTWNLIHYKWLPRYEYKILLLNKFIKSKRYLWISSVSYLVIGILVFVYWTFIDNSVYFSHSLGYLSLSISLFLISINFIFLYRNQNHNDTIFALISFIFIMMFLATCEVALIKLIPHSFPKASIWRLNYLVLGFGSLNDNIITLLLLFVWLINYLINFKSIKWQKISNIFLAFLFLSSNIPVWTNYMYYGLGKNRNEFTDNIQLNINKLSYSDILFLEKLILVYGEKTYLTDGPFTTYIRNGVDVTSYFAYNLKSGFKLNNHNWNWYNFIDGIYSWNSKDYAGFIIENTPESISDQLKKQLLILLHITLNHK